VAVYAIAGDIRVIEVRRCPRHGCVAVVAVVTTGNMRRMLADCRISVMAGTTGTNHLGVIHDVGRDPGIWRMAVFANGTGLDVGWVLARCIRAVVTARAVSGDIDVVKVRR